MLDLDTFIIMIYVFVEEWYQKAIAPVKAKRGRPSKFSDSEMLTVALLSEWRAGVSWQSERGCLRYLQQHYQAWFPHLPQRSAFNTRKRHLLGVCIRLQQAVAELLNASEVPSYESVDSLPIPAASLGQYQRASSHWLWLSRIGHGPQGWFWGDRLLVSVTDSGVITGWLLGSANINDRWLMELFLSSRAGCPQLVQPPRPAKYVRSGDTPPPSGFFGTRAAVGVATGQPYLADGNFNGGRWIEHWQVNYGARVITKPRYNEDQSRWSNDWSRWLAHHRQIIETVFAGLCHVFDIKHLNAHSRWGQATRIALKTAAHNLGLWCNRLLHRPLLALGTLLIG